MKKLFFIFLLATLILPACSPAATSSPAKPIEVSAGSEFTITVRVDRSPEYHWELAEALDPKIIGSAVKEYVPDDANNGSSKGRDVWHFKAIAPGKTTITLGYYQGMTTNSVAMPVFTVIVK